MKTILLSLVTLFVSMAYYPAWSQDPVAVVIETTKGDIEIEVFPDKAPLSSESFLAYVDQGLLVEGKAEFFRVLRDVNGGLEGLPNINVIEGGIMGRERLIPQVFDHESTSKTGLSHKDGAISLSRTPSLNFTASGGSFFICIGDQTAFDEGGAWGQYPKDKGGYAVFGQVTKGMDVVRDIHAGKLLGDVLTTPVSIIRTYRK